MEKFKKIFKNKKNIVICTFSFVFVACLLAMASNIINYKNGIGYFKSISNMNVPRVYHKLFLMNNGNVMVVGGYDFTPQDMKKRSKYGSSSIEIFDFLSNKFVFKKELFKELDPEAGFILLSNDRLLIAGGEKTTKTSFIYDPITNSVKNGPNMKQYEEQPVLVKLKDGRVLFYGGRNSNFKKNKYAEIYDPKANRFVLLKSGPVYNGDFISIPIVLDNGNVLIIHEYEGSWKVELFNQKKNQFSSYMPELMTNPHINSINFEPKRYYLERAVLIKNNRIVLFENFDGEINNIEILDLTKQKKIKVGSMKMKRRNSYNTTLLKNNNILISNGFKGLYDFSFPIYTSEIFDTKKLKFYKIPKFKQMGGEASAILLKDGRVLITGGKGDEDSMRATVYIPR